MMLLLCFDLPRDTRKLRRDAYKYRKKLVEMGFCMKQFSLYERQIRNTRTIGNIVKTLKEEIPEYGQITLYLLPDNVNDKQITILGENVKKISMGDARLIVL